MKTKAALPLRTRPTTARPFVLVNMAMTADGKIATANRRLSSFGSKQDQHHLYELRATVDAVMAGARTLDLNDVRLGPGGAQFRRERLRRGLAEYNLGIVVSGTGSIDPRAAIFQRRFAPLILLTTERSTRARRRRLETLVDELLICGEQELDFGYALGELRRRHGVRRLLCEGGGELNAALFQGGWIDELHLTICPLLLGGRGAPTIADGKNLPLARSSLWRIGSTRRVGNELFVVCRVRR